jgi:hypothetical protein
MGPMRCIGTLHKAEKSCQGQALGYWGHLMLQRKLSVVNSLQRSILTTSFTSSLLNGPILLYYTMQGILKREVSLYH